VIDDGRLVGIITKTDLLRRLRGTDEGSDDTRAD
jgi:CBS domain-containing protein